MKSLFTLAIVLTSFISISVAQTQQQKVKVRTRVTSDMKGGEPIAGAEVKFVGGNRHTSGNDGMFTFAVRGKFEIESATKQGYVMIDPKYLKAFTSYTPDAIPVIMEERSKLNRETVRQTQRINQQLTDENERLMRLNDSLLAAKAITEAKWDSLEQARNNDYLNKIDKVREMAEVFANIDYEMLEEYDRQVYRALSEGKYDEAYRLLKSRKSVEEQKKEINAASAAIDATEQMLVAAKQGRDAKIKEAAELCYHWFNYYKSLFMNDSAAYYLEQRAKLDMNNLEWQLEAGDFLKHYFSDYNKADYYYKLALRSTIVLNGETSIETARFINCIGENRLDVGQLDSAYRCFSTARIILTKLFGNDSKELIHTFSNFGNYYYEIEQYDSALYYVELEISLTKKYLGDEHNSLTISYNNLSRIELEFNQYDSAIWYAKKALSLSEIQNGPDDLITASSYFNTGFAFKTAGDITSDTSYYYKAIDY